MASTGTRSPVREGPVTSGWLAFAGILAILVGIFNMINGLVALLRADYFVVTADKVLLFNYTGWGWWLLIVGAVQIIVGLGILGGATWARITGIVLAALAMVTHIVFLAAFPVWSVIVLALAVLVIYALTVPPWGATAG